jgi:hypothetical protein
MTSGNALITTSVPTNNPAPPWDTLVIMGDGDENRFHRWSVPPGASVAEFQVGGFWHFQITYQFNYSTIAWCIIHFSPTPTSNSVGAAAFSM